MDPVPVPPINDRLTAIEARLALLENRPSRLAAALRKAGAWTRANAGTLFSLSGWFLAGVLLVQGAQGCQRPSPDVDPAPTPAPLPVGGLRVLMVYESSEMHKYLPGQLEAMDAKPVRDYLDSHCAKGPDGKTPEFRKLDPNVDAAPAEKHWRDWLARPRASLPWIVLSNGKLAYEGPGPNGVEAMLSLLKQFGGN